MTHPLVSWCPETEPEFLRSRGQFIFDDIYINVKVGFKEQPLLAPWLHPCWCPNAKDTDGLCTDWFVGHRGGK